MSKNEFLHVPVWSLSVRSSLLNRSPVDPLTLTMIDAVFYRQQLPLASKATGQSPVTTIAGVPREKYACRPTCASAVDT